MFLDTLPNTKVIFIVRNPIGEQITIKRNFIYDWSNFLERLVSDIVQYSSSEQKRRKPVDVNQLIMGRDPNGGHPYYKDLSKGLLMKNQAQK